MTTVDFRDFKQHQAPISVLDPNPMNPRSEYEFEYEASRPFHDLVESIDLNGVLEPIQAYAADDGRLKMLTGHRRLKAVRKVNEHRSTAHREAAERGDETEPDLITTIPVAIVTQPDSTFDMAALMWNSELLREPWPVEKLLPFFKETFDSAPAALQESHRDLAAKLGLRSTRAKLLVTVVTSDVLFRAGTGDALPRAGREKTLRSVNRCAEVIMSGRPDAARQITGRSVLNDEALEIVRERLVTKAVEYGAVDDLPGPGVVLERTVTVLRDESVDDEEVVGWVNGLGVLYRERVATPQSRDGREVPASPAITSALQPYLYERPGRMDDAALNAYAKELYAVQDQLTEAIERAEAAIRRKTATAS